MAQVWASAVHFLFFSKIYNVFYYLDSKEQIIKKYLLLFKIIDLDPLHISSHLLKEVREGENWKSFKENELINFKLNYFITPNCPTGLGPDITKILKQSRYSRQAYNKLNGEIILWHDVIHAYKE